MSVAVTCPIFLTIKSFVMLHSKGQSRCPKCNAILATPDAQAASQILYRLSPAQLKLLEYLDPLDGPDRVEALKLVHDIAVYHSHEPLEEMEKNALYQIKVLWELIGQNL